MGGCGGEMGGVVVRGGRMWCEMGGVEWREGVEW